MSWLFFLSTLVLGVFAQRQIIGDIKDQRVSLLYGDDFVDSKIYRRPPTYLIIASRIVRPSTIYQVVVTLLEDPTRPGEETRVRAALSRDGVEVYGDHINMQQLETRTILLLVPPGNNVDSRYMLRVEGANAGGGAIVFENSTMLQFSRQFLSISISTNKAVYDGGQDIKVRVVMLDTALHPYDDIADLFILDPDGYIIRKWQSKQLNNGILTGRFALPEYPKVGFWTIRIETQGQVEEKRVKVEKYYDSKFEVYVRMPTFVFNTDQVIKADVSAFYPFEKTALGDMKVRWFAKKVDGLTPMYNDTVLYRNEFSWNRNFSNTYRSQLYSDKEGTPTRNVSLTSGNPLRYGYLDPYVNTSTRPIQPLFENWTYIRSEERFYHKKFMKEGPFLINMGEILDKMGTVEGIQIRAEAFVTEYFYGNTQRGFCETRVINQTLSLRFVGSEPIVFKPGMPYEGQISVRYHDQVAVSQEVLEASTLDIKIVATLKGGKVLMLNERNKAGINVPRKLGGEFNAFQDIDRLKHYGQLYGQDAVRDSSDDEINPAVFFSDNIEENTDFLFNEQFAKEQTYEEYRKTGVHRFMVDIPEETETLELTAYFRDDQTKAYADTKTKAYAAYGPRDQHIHVRTSNRKISVGEYAVFHVKSNFPLPYFDWVVVSKNIILNAGREYASEIHPQVTTFSLVVNSEMAPGFHIIVYTITHDDYLLSDSSYFPVQAINRHKIEFSLTQLKDHSKNTVEATCRGDPGAVYLSSTHRQATFASQGKNTITKTSILESLHSFENENRHIHRVFFTDREGTKPDEVTYFPSMDYGADSNRTFELNELVLFTDFVLVPFHPYVRLCNMSSEQLPCLQRGCYTKEQICDGTMDCEDGVDEANCGDKFKEQQEATMRYRLSRFNRYTDYYDSDGDWGFFDVNIDEDREQFFNLDIPLTTDSWFFNVFSISKEHGIGLIDDPIPFDSIRPIHFYCEGPEAVHRGESVGIRCMIMNRTPYLLETFIKLMGSDDYQFIHVEEFGYVTSYAPRRSSGDHHHLVWVRGESEEEVHIPIAPTREQGSITVTIELSTQIMSGKYDLEIEILPEGSIVHRHTSVMLDLKSRAFELEYMNIIVDETPLIPYEIFRRYIYGSAYGKVSVCGDVIGPTFMGNNPVSLETMFPDGNGRHGKGTEYHAFNLAANTNQLHYYRLTNQLNEHTKLVKRVFEQMNVEYTAVMRRMSSTGGFKMWDHSKESVWLTAWCIRIFEGVAFQDWEDYIYIDPTVFGSAVLWLLNYQTGNPQDYSDAKSFQQTGAFSETEHYNIPLSKTMEDKTNRNISLTAHVLISLQKTAPMMQGDLKRYSATARHRALTYLERNLVKIDDPYEMAITAYALALSRSAEADAAYGKLLGMKLEEDGKIYWSRHPIKVNRVRYEFNRPFLEAKDHQIGDALAVEATAYALLTLFLVEGGGVTVIQDQIVEWLNTMRLGDGGFISTIDTIVAMEALVRYSYNSRIKDITNLNVRVEAPDSNRTEVFKISGKDISKLQTINLENVWGHINFYATGAGQAIAQLDVNYGVDFEPFKDIPPKDCFNMSIYEQFAGRNKSLIHVRSCMSWTCTDESPTSGMAMLVVDIPTGYVMEQPDANKIVRSNQIPELKDSDVEKSLSKGKTIWYFERIQPYEQCFWHSVRRYFPVANLTRTRQAVLIEPLRPERFNVKTFNATSLYILSICEVCGSYQCPYCPFYSHAGGLVPTNILIIFMVLVLAWVGVETLSWEGNQTKRRNCDFTVR